MTCNLGHFTASTMVYQRRYAHTDIQWPDFDYYRRDEVKDPSIKAKESAASRKTASYLIGGGKYTVVHFAIFRNIVQQITNDMI